MTHLRPLALSALAALNSAPAPAGQGIAENGRTLTFDGRGGSVRVDGNMNTLTLTGVCTRVTVNGNMNTLRVAAVGAVVPTGNANKLTWHKALKGTRPAVSNAGTGNSFARR